MKAETKTRVQELRQRLANLSDQEKETLAARGMIATVEGRVLSLHNTLLVYLQCNGHQPTVIGGYKQWQKAGKQVKKGEHGFLIWFPVGQKDDEGEIISAERYFTTTVFDISQVQPIS